MSALNRFSQWYFSKKALPYWCVLLLDCIIVFLSGLVIRYFAVGGGALVETFWAAIYGLLVTIVCYILSFRIFRTYSGILRFSSFVDLERVAVANLLGCCFALVIRLIFKLTHVPEDVIVIPTLLQAIEIAVLSTMIMWGERVLVKTLYDLFRIDANADKVFIYGIQDGGVGLAKEIRSENPVKYQLSGFIAPDTETGYPEYLLGAKIYADDDKLVETMEKLGIKHVLVSPLQADHFRNDKQALVDQLVKAKIGIMMLPDAEEWDIKHEGEKRTIHEVDIEELLPRDKIEVDLNAIGELLKDQVVMVTGAAGSIGYEMVRQVAKFKPKHLVLIDAAESPMHTVRLHMAKHYAYIPCETIVSSINNPTKMEKIFSEYKPDYVFHAAAYKHVPMMEDNPAEAVQNNIYGTRIIADLAVKYGARKFVMTSTDKAVNPTNVMGCSKRICEIYCQSLNAAIERGEIKMYNGEPAVTQFITTRFGNVLGSNGSVIPIFRKQILQGGPVTVTHPDIIRFFMLIPEACRLVLEAGTMGKGGEIFVFDMGKPVRIADLAQRMIDLSGAKDVKIVYTGLRDGEKLYEEVLSDKESTMPTVHPKIRVAAVRQYDYALACKNEDELYKLSFTYDDMAIVAKMKEIVPEYRSQHSKYEVLDK